MRKQIPLIQSDEFDGGQSLVIDTASGDVRPKCGLRKISMDLGTENAPGYADVLAHEEEIYRQELKIGAEPLYQTSGVVANGGMGILKLATDTELGRETAMKVIIPELKKNDDIIRVFLREARLTARLQHPNIVPIYRVGFMPKVGVYYTMRYVRGESLATIINHLANDSEGYQERYNHFELLEIFLKICNAVAYAHSQRVIHRDIKPGNIMVGSYGDVLLLDWGLAKEVVWQRKRITLGDAEDDPLERDTLLKSAIKGSPSFMSPEQAIGDNAGMDQRTDIFLLGATLYNIFTGMPPYPGRDLVKIIRRAQLTDYVRPEGPEHVARRIPESVCRLINRAMQRDPRERYQTMEEMIADIEDVLHDKMDFDEGVFEAGRMLIRQGDVGNSLYYILSGEVVVYTTNKLGLTKELDRVGPGEIVGEIALITDAPRAANAKAVVRTEVLILSKRAFHSNLGKMPPWFSKLMRSLAGRLIQANAQNRDLHLRPAFLPW